MDNVFRDIKSFNQKVRRLARKYGTDSIQYQQLISDVERNYRGQTHITKDGAIQINNPKKPNLNDYQKQILVKLKGRKGVKEIEKAAKKRLQDKGISKPTKQEIETEVRAFSERQRQFDKTLDLIYSHELAGDLPPDISDRYNKIYRHGKGAGSGVSNDDIDYIEEKIQQYEEYREQLDDITVTLYNTARAYGQRVPDELKLEIEKAATGEMNTDDIPNLIEKIQNYIDGLNENE